MIDVIRRFAQWCKDLARYNSDWEVFSKSTDERFLLSKALNKPCLGEYRDTTSFDAHYTYHTAWAARILAKNCPNRHVDISSFTYFSTILSAFVPTEFYDFRPANIVLDNFQCDGADINDLPFADEELESVSCMHVVEHIGLGRYGDTLDVQGDLRAIAELKRVVRVGGNLIFVVPIGGVPKIEFNAHRIYSYTQIREYFDEFELLEFALVTDDPGEGLIRFASENQANDQSYGCGCFLFKKKFKH